MPSRMDRYYREDTNQNSRSKKNENLYKSIYDSTEYSNIEGIASISKKGEIDLAKLKEMLEKREQRENERKYRTAKITPIKEQPLEEVEKNYDIRSVLSKAKTDKKEDNKHRSLNHVDYDFLKSLSLKSEQFKKEEEEENTDELTDILKTITSASALSKMGNEELSLDMLSELKPTGNTVADNESIRKLIEEEVGKTKEKKEIDMDQSFFTTNHQFRAEDFESLEDMQTTIKKNNKLLKIFFYFLIVLVVIVIGYFIVKLWT